MTVITVPTDVSILRHELQLSSAKSVFCDSLSKSRCDGKDMPFCKGREKWGAKWH